MRVRMGLAATVTMLMAAGAAAQDARVVVRQNAEMRTRARAAVQQARSARETEQFSRRVRLGPNGRFTIANSAGDISITGGGGDEVSIEAVKRTSGERSDLAAVQIDVQVGAGRLEVRTNYPDQRRRRGERYVSVDFTITVPAGTAVDAHSMSGTVRVSGVRGAVRAQSVSGDVMTAESPRVEMAKSLSGNVTVSGVTAEADLTASTVSGDVRATGVRARAVYLNTVSGSVVISDAACERLDAKSMSGDVEYSGSIARNGRYEINSHSGDVRLVLAGNTGFELTADSFSGAIRSALPVTLDDSRAGAARRTQRSRRSVRGTYGDGSAVLALRTFSGDVEIIRR